jgi:hypothetical protein
MGRLEKQGDQYIYRQDDGQITAWFDNIEEKYVLAHEGNRFYRWVFNLLLVSGGLYLALIFLMA